MHALKITSKDNAQFKQLKKLAGSARERRKTQQTLLDGVHLLRALADVQGEPQLIVLRDDAGRNDEIKSTLARFPRTPVVVLDASLFDELSTVETPTGILAVLAIPCCAPGDYRCAVLLDNIQDPGNVGTILRTAAAAGADAVFLSTGCAEAWSPKSLRAGMGAHFALSIHEQQPLASIAKGFSVVVATSLAATQSLYAVDLTANTAFIFGNEGGGLSAALLDCATHPVSIPMPGKVESLNVAAAVAVCLFERVRQLQSRRLS
jgi:TrmH family RNA methyltransferase